MTNKKGDKRKINQTMAEISKNASSRKEGHNAFLGGSFTPEEKEKLAKGELNLGVRKVAMINTEQDIKAEQEIEKYNENVPNLDPMYASQTPMRKVLVRCYLQEVERTESGIIIPPDQIEIEVPTRSGQGYVGTVTSPWAFSKRAIVVAVPPIISEKEGHPLKPGAEIQLSKKVLRATKSGEEFNFSMPSAYMHWSYKLEKVPEDKSSPHYGYFLVDQHTEIDMINTNKNKENE